MNQHQKRPEHRINEFERKSKCHLCKHNGGTAWGMEWCELGLKWPEIGTCKRYEVQHDS